MENTGVSCDVCACRHNMAGCKCDLPEIKVTEHCTAPRRRFPISARVTRRSNPGKMGKKGLPHGRLVWPRGRPFCAAA